MNRRSFVSGLGTFALLESAARGECSSLLYNAENDHVPAAGMDKLRTFKVTLPRQIQALPFGSDRPGSRPAFALRGIKGWAWSPDQYLREIPVMARYGLNFLMNDYGSLWELGPHGTYQPDKSMNFWYRPLPFERRAAFEKVIRLCQLCGILFCFSVNPSLSSDRQFDFNSIDDLDSLWQHYAWAQSLGVKWFNVSLDDIGQTIDAVGQASLLNTIFERLRAHDPEAQLTFCPSWYAGTGDSGTETNPTLGKRDPSSNDPVSGETPGVRYTRTLAKQLDRDVFLFWTGPEVCSLRIDADQARHYKNLCGHRVLLWDNYPVNDQQPALHLGPLTGRSADLCSVVDGYISNPMAYQDEANRIPLLTVADYLWNPREYDPARSIGQAIAHLGDTWAKRETLRNLVELYPGRLWDSSEMTGWNSLRERVDLFVQRGKQREARRLLEKAQGTLQQMKALSSDTWSSGSEVLQRDVSAVVSQMGGQ